MAGEYILLHMQVLTNIPRQLNLLFEFREKMSYENSILSLSSTICSEYLQSETTWCIVSTVQRRSVDRKQQTSRSKRTIKVSISKVYSTIHYMMYNCVKMQRRFFEAFTITKKYDYIIWIVWYLGSTS